MKKNTKNKYSKKTSVKATVSNKYAINPKVSKASNVAENSNDKVISKKENYPHFRHYKLSNHPALIVNEHSDSEYKYRKVTHSERENNKKNEEVIPNPNLLDKMPMYIVKRVRHDKKINFGKKYNWKYNNDKKK